MKVQVSYKLTALHEVARYVWENNQYVKNWPDNPSSPYDVMNNMKGMMQKYALSNAHIVLREKKTKITLDSEWCSYTGTGGYYFIFTLIDRPEDENSDITIYVDILVDPSIRYGYDEKQFITEVIDEIV